MKQHKKQSEIRKKCQTRYKEERWSEDQRKSDMQQRNIYICLCTRKQEKTRQRDKEKREREKKTVNMKFSK